MNDNIKNKINNFEAFSNILWDRIKEKDVSLAMIFDNENNILWHRGRKVEGKTVKDGKGFSKSFIEKFEKKRKYMEDNFVYIPPGDLSSPSTELLRIKKILIIPINDVLNLYIDSGVKKSFSNSECELFKSFGKALCDIIHQINVDCGSVGTENLVGVSDAIKKMRNLIFEFNTADGEVILLRGDSGVGKSHFAEIIHNLSGRKGKFVTISAPSIPENLFESEFYGHKKGSFTDAKMDKKGFVEEAQGGTLFLDEIAEIPISNQSKLLRFIETKKYTIVGESKELEADVRIIAATNKDLEKAIYNKEFREDLYYRLQTLEFKIPSLKEHKEDIKPLVQRYIHHLKGKEIAEGFFETLVNYEWPGNVRELISILKKAGTHCTSPITGDDINELLKESAMHSIENSFTKSPVDIPLKSDYIDKHTNKQKAFDMNYKDIQANELPEVDKIWIEILSGKNFWEAVQQPFLDRDLNRRQVKEIVKRAHAKAFEDSSHKGFNFSDILKVFNLDKKEYSKLYNFLRFNKLK